MENTYAVPLVFAKDGKAPVDEDLSPALVFWALESEREKGGGLLRKKSAENVTQISLVHRPLLVRKYGNVSVIFDGCGVQLTKVRYGISPTLTYLPRYLTSENWASRPESYAEGLNNHSQDFEKAREENLSEVALLSSDEVRTTARQLLRTTTQCRHCNGTADLEYIRDGFMGVHVCQGRYVTRIITYGKQPNPEEFKRFVQEAVQDSGNVEDSDIRVGRRYAWDLGLDRKSNDLILTETYWTQNYRRTKNDDPNRPALFLCSNKDAFYVQPLTSTETLCPSCRK